MLDLNATGPLSLYVDGADECDPHKRLIKGGGAALTREKIIAAASATFVCIIDPASSVDVLGRVPAAGRGDSDGAQPGRARDPGAAAASPCGATGVVTDNGNVILDVHGLSIVDPVGLERAQPDPGRGQRRPVRAPPGGRGDRRR